MKPSLEFTCELHEQISMGKDRMFQYLFDADKYKKEMNYLIKNGKSVGNLPEKIKLCEFDANFHKSEVEYFKSLENLDVEEIKSSLKNFISEIESEKQIFEELREKMRAYPYSNSHFNTDSPEFLKIYSLLLSRISVRKCRIELLKYLLKIA